MFVRIQFFSKFSWLEFFIYLLLTYILLISIALGNVIKTSRELHNVLVDIKWRAINRSIYQKVFCKKGVLKSFSKLTGKHLCQSFFFNKVAGHASNFIYKDTLA